ncbi:unnamed protein product [Gongylonema pulchrum]|uniref:Ricin B-type lectin domain-containing protein n=1 Tax=Gongylonema pulchrum TaxID=637853 RepID=A0A183EFH0_9BILA|nr:unnamed protein product [Gongylonema pulchrum]
MYWEGEQQGAFVFSETDPQQHGTNRVCIEIACPIAVLASVQLTNCDRASLFRQSNSEFPTINQPHLSPMKQWRIYFYSYSVAVLRENKIMELEKTEAESVVR